MKPGAAQVLLRLQLYVIDPPSGVAFAVQRGKSELLLPAAIENDAIRFELALRIGAPLPDGSFNFLGEFAQGTPDDRFVYVNSGVRAGQTSSCWDRRAKIKLHSIPREWVEAAAGHQDRAIEGRIKGTMNDGGPVCATPKPGMMFWRPSLN